ncbi:hypothetical protein VTI74DRAFT_4092 [Chaetomium olivicolor]
MPRKTPELDLDFNIYVDPSCLSTSMDETPATEMPPSSEAPESIAVPDTPEQTATKDEMKDREQPTEDGPSEEQQPSASEAEATPADVAIQEEPATEVTDSEPAAEVLQETKAVDTSFEETPAAEVENAAQEAATTEEDAPPVEADSVTDPTPEPEAASEPEVVAEPEAVETPVAEDSVSHTEDQEHPAEDEEVVAPQITPEVAPEAEQQDSELSAESHAAVESQDADGAAARDPDLNQLQQEETAQEEHHDPAPEEPSAVDAPDEDAHTALPQNMHLDQDEDRGRPHSAFTDRKTSLRTEALIQAAARAVVAKIEKRNSDQGAEHDEDEFETSLLSTGSQDTYTLGDTTAEPPSTFDLLSRRQSSSSSSRHIPSHSLSSSDGGEHSSTSISPADEPEDDVFSDRSARSSLCSLSDHPSPHPDEDSATKTPNAKPSLSRRDSYASTTITRHSSPRTVSNFSAISGLSQYDDKQFIPTARETRLPFRTPSEIRAMQMASPTPSVFNGSSPRSHKRPGSSSGGGGGLTNVRAVVGSPTVSAQYSPKNRSTPPRFRSRREAPLVLLHVTLLPLRWVWGEVLNGLDAVTAAGKAGAGDAEKGDEQRQQQVFEPSEQLKTLRDAWRELQDRVGDTVLERGILLPHPQNDYEVLEERLLEALELPVKRRARILECGHYLGPANIMAEDLEESDEEEQDEGRETGGKRHWCKTCRDEIRFEALGAGRVFRIKVYASNGLMKAGAWEACWKEMERVDVEVEPIVGVGVQGELERLGALQMEMEEQRRHEAEMARSAEIEAEVKRELALEQEMRAESRQQQLETAAEQEMEAQTALLSSPPPSAMQLATMPPRPQSSASTSLVRAGTPTLAHHTRPGTPLRQSEPMDTSEERRRRDEERMREIYGDMPPQQQQASVPAQLPAPPVPTEQQHQPYHQSNQPYSQALTPAPPPMQMMLTDGTLHHRHVQHNAHDPYAPCPPQQDVYDPNHRHNTPSNKPPPRTFDENSGFVELLMEAFKVLLRDPKNVAIIVLCVFVVVMVRRPGMGEGPERGLQPVVREAPAVMQEVYRYEAPPQKGVGEVVSERERVLPVAAPAEKVAEAEEVLVSTALPLVEEAENVVTLPEPPAISVEANVEEPPAAEKPVQQVFMDISEPEVMEAAEGVPEAETLAEEAPLHVTSWADILGLMGPQYPITMAGEEPVPKDLETVESQDAVEFRDVTEDDQAITSEAPLNTEGTILADDDTAAEAESESIAEINVSAENPDGAELDSEVSDTDSDEEEPLEQCNSPPTPSTSASTSAVFVPGPFVTQHKTVRVFETVTETVRVSVVTQTETVSTVVTAVPQTVEETVYETETVRITVSVPVEEQDATKKKAKATGVGRVKKGKSCGGWF